MTSKVAHHRVTELDDRRVAALLPRRDPRGHKGSNGNVTVVAGSLDYLGAGLLAALAAARAGAGVVRLAVPASLQPLVAGRVPELVTMGLPESAVGTLDADAAYQRIAEADADALVVGPGLLAGGATARLVELIIAGGGPPAVLDAEALNGLAASGSEWWVAAARPLVLTPHPGEFARLDGDAVGPDDMVRTERASDAARRWGQVVVLKGAHTVIASPDGHVARATFENAALSTAGTGDVLSGTIGALLAQGLSSFDAACAGVHLHGAAAARISERLGDAGMLASDLPPIIARVRRDLAALRDPGVGERRMGFGGREPGT